MSTALLLGSNRFTTGSASSYLNPALAYYLRLIDGFVADPR